MSDVMLLGVLRVPVPFPVDAIWLHQFVDRARQAADRIESDAAKIASLRSDRDCEKRLRKDAEETREDLIVERDRLCAEVDGMREALGVIAAQHSGEVCSTKRSDCMAAIASACLDAIDLAKEGACDQ